LKKILVTGANGYIGSHVIKLLIEKDYEIHAISRFIKEDNIQNNIYWHKIDILKTNDIEDLMYRVKPTFLIHLAWKIGSGLKHESNENHDWLEESKTLVSSFYKSGGKRILVSGTCAEYDWKHENLTENITPLNPLTNYGKVKNKFFNFLDSYCSVNNYSFIWPRIFFSFGPNQNENSLVPFVIKKLMNNKVVNTTEAQQKYDYLYIEDIALAIVLLLESNYDGAVNISSGKTTKLKKIINTIAEHFYKKDLIQFGAVPYAKNTSMNLVGNNNILKIETGWTPRFTIKEGLSKTIEHYKKEFS